MAELRRKNGYQPKFGGPVIGHYAPKLTLRVQTKKCYDENEE